MSGYSEWRVPTPLAEMRVFHWGHSGPKALLLHGFPETPHIYEPMAEQLVKLGYQVYAPFLPGYGGSQTLASSDGQPRLEALARCVDDLCQVIAGDEAVLLVGHDWGAVVAYAAAAYCPQRFHKLVVMAVPPLPLFLKGLVVHPSQWQRSAYMAFFQLRARIPERWMSDHDYAALRRLCQRWAGGAQSSQTYFAQPEVFDGVCGLAGPLAYYRGLLPGPGQSWRDWKASLTLAFTTIQVPSVLLVGELDGCIPEPLFEGYARWFGQSSRLVVVPGAGHFLPLDAPETVVKHMVMEG